MEASSSPAINYDKETINTYLKLLEGKRNAIITACIMADDEVVPGFGVKHFPAEAWEKEIAAVSKAGCLSLHVTLNQTNLKGRRTENIQSARVLCVDIDQPISEDTCAELINRHKPDWVCASSPGKYHFYWRIFPSIPLDRWSIFQAGLALKLGGDLNLSAVTSLIRVPGFPRVTKSGEPWLPTLVYINSNIQALTDAGVLERWPRIVRWGEKGLEKLKADRLEAGRAARKAWETRSEWDFALGSKVNGSFKDVKGVGRNVTLYFACKEEFKKKEYSLTQAFEFGEFVNESFTAPLDAHECSKTIISAHNKSLRYWQNRKSVIDSLITPNQTDPTLEPQNAPAEKVKEALSSEGRNISASPSEGFNSKATTAKSATGSTEAKKPTPNPTPTQSSNIPAYLLDAAKKLSGSIWNNDKIGGARALVGAHATKSFHPYAEYLCEAWKRYIGNFRLTGPVVHLKGRSRWGTEVRYGRTIDRDSFKAMISTTVSNFALKMLRCKEVQKELGDTALKEMPKYTILNVVEEQAWKCALLQERQPRQDGHLMVFQNGTLDLERGMFEPDDLAPLKHSHPLWFELNRDVWTSSTTINWDNVEEWSAWFNTHCPVASKYFNDWMPSDCGAWKLVLRYFGYAFTTDNSQQKFMFLFGPTRAGKGSICRTFSALVGDGNYASGEYSMLSGGFKSAEIADKLIVAFEEVEGTEKEHNVRLGFLKKLLGGERVMFERKYGQPFEDKVIAKFVMQSNEPLLYMDRGNAVRARMLALGLERSFEGREGLDPAQEILESEASALGTAAARAWFIARREAHKEGGVFRLAAAEEAHCRAVSVGKSEVVERLDLVGEVMKKYLKFGPDESITSLGFVELVRFVADERGLSGKITTRIEENDFSGRGFKGVQKSTHLKNGDGARVRGWLGASLNTEALFSDFPELEKTALQGYSGQVREALMGEIRAGVRAGELISGVSIDVEELV